MVAFAIRGSRKGWQIRTVSARQAGSATGRTHEALEHSAFSGWEVPMRRASFLTSAAATVAIAAALPAAASAATGLPAFPDLPRAAGIGWRDHHRGLDREVAPGRVSSLQKVRFGGPFC